MRKFVAILAVTTALAGTPVGAQNLLEPAAGPPSQGDAPTPANEEEVTFASDTITYDTNAEVVVSTGNVRMARQGDRLRADRVEWNQKTGEVRASGNVAVVNSGGDTVYGDSVVLTDSLRDGVVENLLLVLNDGGRLAAKHGVRKDGVSTLTMAAYTPCAVLDSDGCPKEPIWKISATKVVHDPGKHRISYDNARISFMGTPILWLPGLSHPDGSGAGGGSGFLLPQVKYSRVNGAEFALPYYFQLAPNRDLSITPHVYSKVLPSIEAQYRQLTSNGAWQAAGMLTYGTRVPINSVGANPNSDRTFRGYIDANGKFQLDPYWTISGATRLASDRSFMRRYDISRDSRLRTTINAERIDNDSYLSISGWAVQTLRIGDSQGQQPIALPLIDYRRRIADPLLGGIVSLQANTLAITRTGGQDTQRAFTSARWDLRRFTGFGQELTLTAYARGDVYHTANISSTITPSYRGDPGWTPRGIGALAADLKWPFLGPFLAGSQRITPRVQIVATPRTKNLAIPNEDARSIDLEDSNLFALNRFAGYDRWEDGNRVTYGAEWSVDVPGIAFSTVIGQSYRLNSRPSILPPGTGLDGRFSDIVGRTTLQYGRFLEITHRFRVDKNSLSIRRNELDATIGSRKTYATIGYLRLNRNIPTSAIPEDLRDREEARLGGRVQFARYWSIFGSTTIDLTGPKEDPLSTADGYQPVRHRLGLLYDDDCFELGVTWRRDYDAAGDARTGNTFLLRVALKNLGR
ncbi:LPS-assembly protein LptD [Sphingomonas montanisoli]|uniref:LPS-assembly protein LptD n=1 Tax=Sphingomonas montanisoli TaxID=2606412 RepID=A0A5D9CCK6_9SPHN|nr:LPS assembly protein LptD [Sphingomonas montanisoli]TZG28993.1 LPS-assembly protein LptD [Sphingomonas montanisoli]